jgi:multimeric flavodoxin WrbA
VSFADHYYLLESKERESLERTIKYLQTKENVLLLTTSNRWEGSDDVPKSTLLARHIEQQLAGKCKLIDVSKLKIYDCEGNVSDAVNGYHCGTKQANLKDKDKNPSGCHRCWASINHKDDELWKVSKALLESNAVLFLGSVRWGQANAIYSRLIERLTWLESRHSTLRESNIIKDIEAGVIFIGQNWNGQDVIETQKQVLKFFGFKVPNVLSWNWQFTKDASDETMKSYKEASSEFKKLILK